jgi:hypothetical protein
MSTGFEHVAGAPSLLLKRVAKVAVPPHAAQSGIDALIAGHIHLIAAV